MLVITAWLMTSVRTFAAVDEMVQVYALEGRAVRFVKGQ